MAMTTSTTTAQAYQTLLAPPDVINAEQLALAVINARYKTWDQFDHDVEEDGAVESAKVQAEGLKAQLATSRSSLKAFLAETRATAAVHLHSAQELSLVRHALADELAQLASELESAITDERGKPTLLEELEGMHRSLKELQTVRDYVQVIAHALDLSEKAVSHLAAAAKQTGLSPSHAAITTYQALDTFVSSIANACDDVEDGMSMPLAGGKRSSPSLHLVVFLEGVRAKTWADMKGALANTLIAAAERLKWPAPVTYDECKPADRKEFESAFAALLTLQDLGSNIPSVIVAESGTATPSAYTVDRVNKAGSGLYPLQALATPVALRFKFHFDGTRQTNRLDKPEWYFTHVLNVAHEHRAFLDTVIQRLLPAKHKHISAWREFVLLLLPLLARKLRKTVPSILHLPALLAHTTYQALSFDAALREQGFELVGTSAVRSSSDKSAKGKPGKDLKEQKPEHWKGISDIILGREDWFAAWLEGERKFAEDQYNDIIAAPDAWLVANDSSADDSRSGSTEVDLRPTNSARRLKLLIEQVTDRYTPLPAPAHRTRFLANAQLLLLDAYRGRMASSLDAFETLSSAFVRAVPGALGVTASGPGSGAEQGVRWGGSGSGAPDTKRLTVGVEGLMRLAKAFVSSRYVAGAMRSWGDDLFFLELWTDMNRIPELRSRTQAWAGSSTLLPSLSAQPLGTDDTPEGTLFDALIEQYEALAQRAEGMMVQHTYLEIESGLRAHFHTSTSTTQESDLQVPTTLLGPVALLSSHLTFLAQTLPSAAVTGIYRPIASRLATHILQRQILYRGRARISPDEGKRIAAAAELWVQTCRAALSRTHAPAGRVEAPWRRYLQAARILGADDGVWRKIVLVTLGGHDDEKWKEAMKEAVGVCELEREEATNVIKMRSDGNSVL